MGVIYDREGVKKMKEKKSLDVKSFVTINFTIALIILLFISIFKSEDIFSSVFLLFTNLSTAVFTYFFTKKKEVVSDENKSSD